ALFKFCVCVFGLASTPKKPLLYPRRDARKEGRIEFADIRIARRVTNRVTLIESPPHRPWAIVAIFVGDVDDTADGVEARQQGLRKRRDRHTRLSLQFLERLCGLVDVATVAAVADREGNDPQHRDDRHRRVGAELKRGFLELQPSVDTGETGL